MRTNFNFAAENIKIVRGDTLEFGVTINDDDGNAQDIDASYFTVRNSGSLLFQKSLNSGIVRNSAGKYVVRVAPADTKTITPDRYDYQFVICIGNDVYTILYGIFEIIQNIAEVS